MKVSSANWIATVMERISSLLGPRVTRAIARFNNWVTNPIQRLWAPHLPNMAVVEHRGRKSGNDYRTPVMAFVGDDELVVVLNYGAGSDWVRNVQAAGSAGILHRGKRYRLIDPRVVPIDTPGLPAALRAVGTPSRCALHGTLVPV
jgi:deazaflavin-dependent oxidoreductase (nitroreductase family)